MSPPERRPPRRRRRGSASRDTTRRGSTRRSGAQRGHGAGRLGHAAPAPASGSPRRAALPAAADSGALAEARRLDAADPLARFRREFVVSDPRLIYLDGNSLGRLPRQAGPRLRKAVDREWGGRLIRGWGEGWFTASQRIGAKLATLVGAAPSDVVVADSTSVNLFKLAVAALRARPDRRAIVTDEMNFPTDFYVLQGAIDLLGQGHRLVVVKSEDGLTVSQEALARAIDGDTALVALSHTAYRSAFVYDMAAVTALAHRARRADPLGPVALGGRRAGRPRGGAGRRRRGLHVQVRERRPGRAVLPLRPRGPPRIADESHLGLVRAPRPVRHGAGLQPGAGDPALPGGHAAHPVALGGRAGRRSPARGRHGPRAREVRGADRVPHPAVGARAPAARVRPQLAAGRRAAGLPHLPRARGGAPHRPVADRRDGGAAGLPLPRQPAARRRAALHVLRRSSRGGGAYRPRRPGAALRALSVGAADHLRRLSIRTRSGRLVVARPQT